MSPDDRAAWIRGLVSAAPPLTPAQAATLRGTLLSGLDNEKPPEPRTQGAAHSRNGDQNLAHATDETIGARRGSLIEVP